MAKYWEGVVSTISPDVLAKNPDAKFFFDAGFSGGAGHALARIGGMGFVDALEVAVKSAAAAVEREEAQA